MPQRQEWITSAAENLKWFEKQFRLHLESDDPDWGAALKIPGNVMEVETARPAWGTVLKKPDLLNPGLRNPGGLILAMTA
jgi:hypothetical protein